MNRSTSPRTDHRLRWLRRALPALATLAATLASAPGHAITIPNLPLQTGTAYPPANVMFILDDSGSMVFEKMPSDGASPLSDTVSDKSYVNNTIFYNPAETYLPWMSANGSRYATGTTYGAAYADLSLASATIDLSDTSSCRTVDRNGSNRSICGGTQTYFVPKEDATDYSSNSNFYRYQILWTGTGSDKVLEVVRSTYGARTTSSTDLLSEGSLSANTGVWTYYAISVPNGTIALAVSMLGTTGTTGNGNLYVREGSNPTTSKYDCRSNNSGNTESCSISNPDPGTWYVGIYSASKYTKVNLGASYSIYNEGEANSGCSTASGNNWRDCTFVTPTGRSKGAEMNNYATWFSYQRTRIKVAKSGASEAFGQLGSGVRVGYDSIWNRDSTSGTFKTSTVGSNKKPAYKIPVDTDGGLFRGSNRSNWFAQLQGARGYSGTPLKGALQRSGKYFEDTGATGPWGPGTSQLSCRQNFSILTTDGFWNNDAGYESPVGDSDSAQGEQIVSEDTKTSFTYMPINPYKDDFVTGSGRSRALVSKADTLADVANYYWKRDLVTTLANNVPASTADIAFWQHMVTFGVSIGLQGRLDPKTDLQSITNGSKNWGDPTDAEDLDRIDDLWHASVNGHGNFVSAANPSEFVQGLIDALATVAQRLGSASNVTANSTSFQTDTRVYQASYVSGKWSGELAAYEVSAAGISSVDADGDGVPDAAWQASKQLPAAADRNFFTWSGTTGTTFPTTAQQTSMAKPGRADINGGPTTGAQSVAYMKGSQALEVKNGGKLRDRDSLLGDIANSSPMYVSESQTIYVGANDGMLHGFDALTGVELFAYVPAGIDFADLSTLSDPQYSPSHRYFVDGPVVVSSTTQTAGKNYLVATLGRGGRGIFGLDVTSPTAFDATDVLWDKTGSGLGNDMGQILGEPLIATLNSVDGSGHHVQAVIVSNGINSPNGNAVLFVLNLVDGSIIAKIDTGIGGDNGLSAPRGADSDGDGRLDYVYAGDLKGNIWKFDLKDTAASNWGTAFGGSPLFTATDSTGKAQPITAGLSIARDPDSKKIWVFAGTGSFMTTGDVSSNDVQSMYGLIDDGPAISGRDKLVDRDIIVVKNQDGHDVRGFESPGTMPASKRGWFVDLDEPSPGERIVSNPRVRGIVLLFASMVPPKENTCEAGGTGYINAIDPFTGTSLANPYFDGNGDGKVDDNDRVTAADDTVVVIGSIDLGVGMPTLPTLIDKLLVVGGSKGTLGSVTMNPQGSSARRVSWREILRD